LVFAEKDNCLHVFGESAIKIALVGLKFFNTDEKFREFSSLRDFNETYLLDAACAAESNGRSPTTLL